MKLILSGQTPSQKNAKHIAINRRTGQRFPMTDPKVKAWQNGAILEVKSQLKSTEPFKTKVYANYMFYVKDNRRRDLSNMIQSVEDVLVKAGVLEDDCWKWLSIAGADAEIDTNNPRCEVYLDD